MSLVNEMGWTQWRLSNITEPDELRFPVVNLEDKQPSPLPPPPPWDNNRNIDDLLCQEAHHKLGSAGIRTKGWTEDVTGGMVPAVVYIIGAVRAQGSGQRLSVDAHIPVAGAGTRQFDSCHLAHDVHDVQGTLGLLAR